MGRADEAFEDLYYLPEDSLKGIKDRTYCWLLLGQPSESKPFGIQQPRAVVRGLETAWNTTASKQEREEGRSLIYTVDVDLSCALGSG